MSLSIAITSNMNVSKPKQEESDLPLIVANQQHLASNLREETVILSLKNGKYYGLNEVGARVWELIQEPISHPEIVQVILEEYDVEEQVALEEINTFLRCMKAEGLIDEIYEQNN